MPFLKREWTPHPKQREILTDPTRPRVVPAGRRFGETKMARGELIETAFAEPGTYAWFVAPTDADARELGFDPLLAELPEKLLAGEPKRTPPREVRLTNGSRIQFRGATSQGRGRGLDLVVVDEAGECPNESWTQVIRPSLLDTQGRALVIGTPKGRDWFFDLYQRGEDPADGEVAAFRATSYDNPHIPDADVEAERATMPERVFRQEYLAEFVSESGSVFGNVRERNCLGYHVADVTGTPPYTTGVDIARQSDYLAALTLDDDGMLVGFLRDRGFSWASARRRLEQYLTDYPGTCYMDATRDNAVVEDLASAVSAVRVEPVTFTAQAKADLIENLAARLETGDIVLPEPSRQAGDGRERPTDALLAELDAFTYDTTASGNVSYHAPEGYHDDCVDALALAAKHAAAAVSTW